MEQVLDTSLLLMLLNKMLMIRLFEERCADLIDSGEIKAPCHLYIGQEAIATGVCAALEKTDYVWGGHRSHGHYLAKGGDLERLMAEIFGKVSGCSRGRGGSMHIYANDVQLLGTVPLVAATIPIAVGAGLAEKLKRGNRISVAFFGDGAAEEGHFFESVNFAALHELPVVFVCENNFYSSHLHILERRKIGQIEKIGPAMGVPSVLIDGNDVVEVYRTACESVRRARHGNGPTLIVCETFRWRGHVGSAWDEDVGVKRKEELGRWLKKDPIARLEKKLTKLRISKQELAQLRSEAQKEVDKAVAFARDSLNPPPEDLLKWVYPE